MQYLDDFDLAQEYGARAMQLMVEHNIPNHPHNYEVWYCYAGQRLPGLTQQIDERINAEVAFTDEFNRELYETHIVDGPVSDAANDASERLTSEIDKLFKLVDAAADNSTDLGRSVRSVSEKLPDKPSSKDVVTAVEAIISATRKMEARSRDLEGKLQDTKTEIEDLRENLENAKSEAMTDGLTGIANRKAFDEALVREVQQAMEDGTPLSLLMADIDHFKQFNDMWGHRVGDQVLRLAAMCIRSNIKGRDTAARYGGEEFAVILPSTTLSDGTALGNQIREAVQARELVKKSTGETLGRITLSLGLAEFRPGEPIAELIERADACLYAAKDAGRNKLIDESSPEMKPRAVSA